MLPGDNTDPDKHTQNNSDSGRISSRKKENRLVFSKAAPQKPEFQDWASPRPVASLGFQSSAKSSEPSGFYGKSSLLSRLLVPNTILLSKPNSSGTG